MNTPTTASTTMNPTRVMPLCFCLMSPTPLNVCFRTRPKPRASANAVAYTREIDPAIDVHPYQERLAPQVALRKEAPVSTVLAVVAIVTHHEILPFRYNPLAFARIPEWQPGTLQHLVRTALELLFQQFGAGHFRAVAPPFVA